ncbi:MAG: tetratricopeptide repeat protein [Thermodesulfobacteriota bacterium]
MSAGLRLAAAALGLLLTLTAGPATADTGFQYMMAAQAAREQHQFEKAIELYTKAVQAGDLTRENLAVTYLNRGLTCLEIGLLEKALADFTQALEVRPDYQKAFLNRGSVLEQLGRYDQAAADFTRALDLDPRDHQAFYNRGLVWFKMGEYERAVADYSEAVRLKPDFAGAYGNRALAWDKLGKLEAGLADARKRYELDRSTDAQALVDYFEKRMSQ